jgi:hypothetical protein
MIRRYIGNGLWTLSNALPWFRYRAALRDVRQAQERILFDFLRANADSAYGKRYEYRRLRSVSQFQEAVPVVGYEDLAPWIEQIRFGRARVLTCEPVLMMEKTSGSSASAKYIPYTASLLREFQRGVGAWMFDLFSHRTALLGGSQYWSLSPCARTKEVTPGGLPVGFTDDAEYLGKLPRQMLRLALAVPAGVCATPDMDACRRSTLDYLMRCRDLRFVSVWSPSFLTLLMNRLPKGTGPCDWWPDLRMISCWASAAAGRFLPEIRDLFPGVEIQGKGLMATEGIVSFPEVGRPAPSPAITSHFLEFLGEDGKPRLVDEVNVGARYSVVITTGGGLARYALGDMVDVIAPGAIEFVGRGDHVSDLCGEKLSEAFVARVLEQTGAGAPRGFALLTPEWANPPHYLLFVESEESVLFAREVEKRLRTSVHYDYCRRLGQLGPVEAVQVTRGSERYLRGCELLGQRAGNVKPACLRRELDWRRRLVDPTSFASAWGSYGSKPEARAKAEENVFAG